MLNKPACATGRRSRRRAFTTVELLSVVLLLAILATLALPSYQQQLRRLRRAEALTALATIQQAQERRRAEQPTYTGTLGHGGLGLADTTPGGHYRLATATATGSETSAYSATAQALGDQRADSPCTFLRVQVQGGVIRHSSGHSDAFDNDAAANRRCWNQP